MIEIYSNGSRWAGQPCATIDELIEVLGRTPLDPTFEAYGNFISGPFDHGWDNPRLEEHKLLNPCTNFFGNFYEVSHVFNIWTDEPAVIDRLTAAIRANQATPAYLDARAVRQAQDAERKARQQARLNRRTA